MIYYNMIEYLLAFMLLVFGVAGIDEYMTCGRTGKQLRFLLDDLPCDLRKIGYCTIPGRAYPWVEVREFVNENKGLMRRMYGEIREGPLLRTEVYSPELDAYIARNPTPHVNAIPKSMGRKASPMIGSPRKRRTRPPPSTTTTAMPSTSEMPDSTDTDDEDFAFSDIFHTSTADMSTLTTMMDEDFDSEEPELETEPTTTTTTRKPEEELSKKEPSRGVNACPVREEVLSPYWANNTRGEVLALLNVFPFEQFVHWEMCTYEHKQMFCRDGCRCEQQYRLHRMLAFDPTNECRGIFSDWFKFPSCCVCKCYDLPRNLYNSRQGKMVSSDNQTITDNETRDPHPKTKGNQQNLKDLAYDTKWEDSYPTHNLNGAYPAYSDPTNPEFQPRYQPPVRDPKKLMQSPLSFMYLNRMLRGNVSVPIPYSKIPKPYQSPVTNVQQANLQDKPDTNIPRQSANTKIPDTSTLDQSVNTKQPDQSDTNTFDQSDATIPGQSNTNTPDQSDTNTSDQLDTGIPQQSDSMTLHQSDTNIPDQSDSSTIAQSITADLLDQSINTNLPDPSVTKISEEFDANIPEQSIEANLREQSENKMVDQLNANFPDPNLSDQLLDSRLSGESETQTLDQVTTKENQSEIKLSYKLQEHPKFKSSKNFSSKIFEELMQKSENLTEKPKYPPKYNSTIIKGFKKPKGLNLTAKEEESTSIGVEEGALSSGTAQPKPILNSEA